MKRSTAKSKSSKHAKSVLDAEQKEDGEISDDESDSDEEEVAAEEDNDDVVMVSMHRNRSILTQRKLISYCLDDDDVENGKDYDDGTSCTSSVESVGRNSPHTHTAYSGDQITKYTHSCYQIVKNRYATIYQRQNIFSVLIVTIDFSI